MEELDIVAVGDIVTDAFIRLKDASVNCDINHESCQLCVRFGDKVPYEFVEEVRAVGNSANASVCAARLGLKSGLISNIGDDEYGRDMLDVLGREGVNSKYVTSHPGMKSNYHYVLWYESERTILVKHEDYPYVMPMQMPAPKWLYLSSLGAAAEHFHDDISAYLMLHPHTKLAFQPGTFQVKLGYQKLKVIYEHSEIFFCNVEEAKKVLETMEEDPHILLSAIRQLGPKTVVITNGTKGAYAFDGTTTLFIPPYPDTKPPYDRTGAGDAFAATVVSVLAMGQPLETALQWGPINSMSVVQQVGAQRGLLRREEILRYLGETPEGYKVQRL